MIVDIKGARVYLAPFFIFCVLVFGLVFRARAEVPVVDLGRGQVTVTPASPASTRNNSYPATPATASKQDALGILFGQMQTLQQEVSELRGTVEQQQNEIQQLKQQQKDNYLDVDRRLSELQQQGSAPASSPSQSPTLPLPPAASAGNEKNSYDQAYGLLYKNQKEEAVLAFRKHILLYPQGELTPNAYYWLGQLYLSQAKLSEAEEQLTELLKQYPQHHKVVDAKFSLGKVYFQRGNKAESRKLIQEVAQSDSPTAQLAQKYLQDNF